MTDIMNSAAAHILVFAILALAPLHGQQAASQPTPTASQPAPFDWVTAVQPKTEWHRQPIGQGVHMWSKRFAGPDGKPQSITVVQARLDPPTVRLDVVAGDADGTPDKHPMSWFGEQEKGSVAAINGGFFHVPTGRSLGLLRVDEATVHPVEKEKGQRACVGITPSGAIRFDQRELGNAWVGMEDALQAGPMLVRSGAAQEGKGGFWTIRHPRSAIGITAQDDAVMVVVDGRTEQAVGMSLDELAQVMLALGCVDAMNLDGGGSSAMWARTHGVVSHPCDNKAFDHVGERKVANAIVLRAPLVRVLDDAEAIKHPEDGWQRHEHPGAVGGSAIAARKGVEVALTWSLALPAGRYALDVRRVSGPMRWSLAVSPQSPEPKLAPLDAWYSGVFETDCYFAPRFPGELRSAPAEWVALWGNELDPAPQNIIALSAPNTLSIRLEGSDGTLRLLDAVRIRQLVEEPR